MPSKDSQLLFLLIRFLPLILPFLFCVSFAFNRETYQTPPECDVNDPLSWYGRLPDGRCLVINECQDAKLNECSPDAQCIDQAEGYSCRCKPGFADVSPQNGRPGTVCRRQQNECGSPSTYAVDCDQNAACVDTAGGYECRCHPGYTDISESFSQLPGRKCVVAVNECEDRSKNDCSENAICTDAKESYTCTCNPGFVDASANVGKYPGRICNKPFEKLQFDTPTNQCDPNQSNPCPAGQICTQNSAGHYNCQCGEGATFVDGKCQIVAACQVDPECDKNANCINVLGSYSCQCKPGFFDVDKVTPGRECKQLSNECADRHDCSPFAKCVDNKDGFECICNAGYTDVSSQFGLRPGRKCVNSSNECAERSLNTCDENADCIDTPQGYSCQCFAGYVDVSSNAHLPPGRVCTVQTSCPKQRTDLIFLIDGSGSIGSQVFRNEVLRFIKEFIELFDIGLDNTRVGLIQYSDQIRHEFNLNQYSDKQSLLRAVDQTQYLTGLTRTGAAIQHMVTEGFSERRGVRPISEGANRVAVVITDGRSQDNVTQPAIAARNHQVNTFAIGVTDHVSSNELENIAGSPNRWFFVEGFKELDMRLRSLVQKLACPTPAHTPHETIGGCNADTQTGCDRALGQICVIIDGSATCQCPTNFQANPLTKICGGDLCNPEVSTSCPYPEYCQRTPLGNYRCLCPSSFSRDSQTGECVSSRVPLPPASPCPAGKMLSVRTGKCLLPGACDPTDANSCDLRKRELCLRTTPQQSQQSHPQVQQVRLPTAPPTTDQSYRKKHRDTETYETKNPISYVSSQSPDYTCQCVSGEKRHPITGVCLRNECLRKEDNDCDTHAQCIDTDEGFLCVCLPGFMDNSQDKLRKPGRVCTPLVDECSSGIAKCSPHAKCTDTPEGYVCRCLAGYIDFSPNPQHESGLDCRPLVDECTTGQHTCHPNATCHDTADSYTCQCNSGFKDMDELRNPGRNCQPIQTPRNPCQDGTHNCHTYARCRPTGTLFYTCECLAGYEDKSPPEQSGRFCVPKQPICLDKSKMDCHQYAICQETNAYPEGFTCHCRDGYMDKSVDKSRMPGRICQEKVNYCMDRSLNDCDVIAFCEELADGYNCTCPAYSIDQSPMPKKPGRNCKLLKNECLNPAENNCSRFADCIDKTEGYECECRPGFRDENPANPGTSCRQLINECKFSAMNDCSPHANCIDLPDGYTCVCKPPYVDEGPKEKPGRVCCFDECANQKDNDCDKENAICEDLEEGFTCKCKPGYYDVGKLPGRTCQLYREPTEQPKIEPSENCTSKCGDECCNAELGEVCVGGAKCKCLPEQSRAKEGEKCEAVERTSLLFRLVSEGSTPLLYSSSEYGTSSSPSYVDFANTFSPDLGKAVSSTQYAPRYILTEINYITHPKTVNSTWHDGLLVNFTVGTRPSPEGRVDTCDLWNALQESIQKTNGAVGGGKIQVATDIELLSPCPKTTALCGGLPCRPELGEICIGEELCGCPPGQKRAGPDEICRQVIAFTFPVWVVRKYQHQLQYNESFANPQDSIYKLFVTSFESGVRQSYAQTPLQNAFVVSEVRDISPPSVLNGSWDQGVLYNATMFFRVGQAPTAETAYNTLVRWIIDRNNFQVGQSGLFINPMPSPFGPCFMNDCHPKGICIATGPNSYRCECAHGYRDMSVANPGHDCVPLYGINECENTTLNECSEHAQCFDLEYLYRCECLRGFKDISPKGAVAGSKCVTDFCAGVNFCSANSTGENLEDKCFCHCKPNFVDLRNETTETERIGTGLSTNQYCLLEVDINECLFPGLHNCSEHAECIDLAHGYTCKCSANYTDENPQMPGRNCTAAAVPIVGTAVPLGTAGGILPFLLPLLLALLFLLLALCCCLWALSRMRWLGGKKRAFDALDTRASDESLYGQALTIPRARLDEDIGSMASSEYTIREEVERRVTTEVTRTEEEMVGGETTFAEEEQVGDKAHTFSQSHSASYYGGGT
ncbi:hypothetical protein niasHS_005863 [Heterodera schachtii]|uniref:Transmembrane matrix receptor MUP-4 n=1 Tax=Heterodera schachtii TaxID=97005 RepID=A0ABD2JS00_HETSC